MLPRVFLPLVIISALAQALESRQALETVQWMTGNAKVDNLINQLTPAEKISLVHGSAIPGAQNQAGYVNPIPRLGIPAVQLSDGEAGINVVQNATAIPLQLNIGATWSKTAAYGGGLVTGQEAKALNMTVALAPRVNVLRDPLTGNFWQSYSEDPYLNAQLGVEGVKGIQDAGTMANPKQIGPSSSGASSGDINSIVDLQTLHEVYWSAPGSLMTAGAATLMCSYAQVNGVPACQNTELFNAVRNVYNFTGIVMSDWTATHSTDPSIIAGLDWEMPQPVYFGTPLYNDIYVTKNLSETYLNRALGHILNTYDRFGLLQGNNTNTAAIPVSYPLPEAMKLSHAKIAYDIAVKSGTLLKNANNTLPLDRKSSFGVFGPNGLQYSHGTNFAERAYGFPDLEVSPLYALQNRTNRTLPNAVGIDLEGTLIPATYFRTFGGQTGLARNNTFGQTAVDPVIDFGTSLNAPLPTNTTYTWTGQLYANTSGLYRLSLQRPMFVTSNGNANPDYLLFSTGSLAINGSTITTGWRIFGDGGVRPWSSSITTRDGWDNMGGTVSLGVGWHNITIVMPSLLQQPVSVRMNWVTPQQRATNIALAASLAATVTTPVVFAFAESPAKIPLALNDHQEDLIAAIAAANPNVVVVLMNSEPVLMPWLPSVQSVLEMYYPGQEAGWAIADLLLGARNPQGRLPVTYPASLNQTVTRDPAHPERMATASGNATFSEGLDISYRYYNLHGTPLLFPFGHGLSYTRFEYSDLTLTAGAFSLAGGNGDTAFLASFYITNTGGRAGVEVPQVYLSPPIGADVRFPGAAFASVLLAGFDNVELAAGESKLVNIRVARAQLSFWNVSSGAFQLAEGGRDVFVGRSAREFVLNGTVFV